MDFAAQPGEWPADGLGTPVHARAVSASSAAAELEWGAAGGGMATDLPWAPPSPMGAAPLGSPPSLPPFNALYEHPEPAPPVAGAAAAPPVYGASEPMVMVPPPAPAAASSAGPVALPVTAQPSAGKRTRVFSPGSAGTGSSGSVVSSGGASEPPVAAKVDRRKKRHKATETVRRVRINSLIDEIREVTDAPKPNKTAVLERALEMLRDYRRLKAMEEKLVEARRLADAHARSDGAAAQDGQAGAAVGAQALTLCGASTTASIAVWSLDMRIVDANDNFLELTGYTRDEVARRAISGLALSRPDQLNKCMEAMTTLLSGRADTARMHKAVVRKDKSIVWVLSTAVLIDDAVRSKRHLVTVMQRVGPPSGKRVSA